MRKERLLRRRQAVEIVKEDTGMPVSPHMTDYNARFSGHKSLWLQTMKGDTMDVNTITFAIVICGLVVAGLYVYKKGM